MHGKLHYSFLFNLPNYIDITSVKLVFENYSAMYRNMGS